MLHWWITKEVYWCRSSSNKFRRTYLTRLLLCLQRSNNPSYNKFVKVPNFIKHLQKVIYTIRYFHILRTHTQSHTYNRSVPQKRYLTQQRQQILFKLIFAREKNAAKAILCFDIIIPDLKRNNNAR